MIKLIFAVVFFASCASKKQYKRERISHKEWLETEDTLMARMYRYSSNILYGQIDSIFGKPPPDLKYWREMNRKNDSELHANWRRID